MSLEAQANDLGIPMMITIDNGLRYSDCDAHEATLVSIEGQRAVYQGQCMMGHHYEQSFLIKDLKEMAHIENGEIVYGQDEGFKADDLEEF